MSQFSGPQQKGAMQTRRADKKQAAERRNLNALPRRRICGHIHGAAQASRCEVTK